MGWLRSHAATQILALCNDCGRGGALLYHDVSQFVAQCLSRLELNQTTVLVWIRSDVVSLAGVTEVIKLH